jgi:hypothetical protein
MEGTTKAKHQPDNAANIFRGVLSKFSSVLTQTLQEDVRIMRDTVAFAHCFLAENLDVIAGDSSAHPQPETRALVALWSALAQELSPEIHRLQCLKQGIFVENQAGNRPESK